jgi:hypothetical protein
MEYLCQSKKHLSVIGRLKSLQRHIHLVQEAGIIVAMKIANEDEALGIEIMRLVQIHDNSKFYPLEFDNLWWRDNPKFNDALRLHREANPHHPEYHKKGIAGMSDAQIAEMVCDWYARSCEFGTSFRFFISNEAPKRWKIDKDKMNVIYRFANILIDKPFPRK